MQYIALIVIAICWVSSASATEVIFEGVPVEKVLTTENEVTRESLNTQDANDLKVVIVRQNGKYYWRSRGGVELFRQESGIFTTYVAANGSGYIRINEQSGKNAGSPSTGIYSYSEHLVHLLGSVTYYGR